MTRQGTQPWVRRPSILIPAVEWPEGRSAAHRRLDKLISQVHTSHTVCAFLFASLAAEGRFSATLQQAPAFGGSRLREADFEFGRLLGRGACSYVQEARHRRTRKLYAIKVT